MASNVGNIKVKLNLDSAAYEQGIRSAVGSVNFLSTALGALGIGFGAIQVKEFITDMSRVSVEMDGLVNKFNAAAGGAQFGANSLQFVKDEAKKLGLVFESSAESFSGFEAAALRSGLTLEQTKTIFDDIARAATSLHLTGERTELVFRALEQMASKSVVSMEELRRQLGDSLPGAVEIGAKAMGVSTAAFNKMVSSGEVMASEFLPKFAKAIREELGGESDKAATQANAAFNRFQNSLFYTSDTIGDSLNPALAELATHATSIVDGLNEDIKATHEWVQANQQLIGGLTDAGIAIAALAVSIPTIMGLVTVYKNFADISGKVTYSQIALSAILKGELKAAIVAITLEVKALTAALWANPWTWVIAGLTTAAAAMWAYQQNTKNTERTIDSLNATQDQNVDKTTEAIRTIKELDGVKKLDYDATKRLDSAIAYLTEKYPNYIGKLRQELKLKGEITDATAKQIAAEMTLAKTKGISKEIDRLENQKLLEKKLSATLKTSYDADYLSGSNNKGVTKATQNNIKEAKKQLESVKKEQKAIVDELTSLNKPSAISGFDNTPVGKKGKTAKQQAAEAKRAAKESLDYKIANLEVEKYKTKRTADEIYEIELRQAQLKIDSAKKGTSDYAQALAAKLKLERDYEQKQNELQSQYVVDDLQYDKQSLNSINMNLELQYEARRISKIRMLELEIANINEKKRLEREALAEQLKLVSGNAAEEVKIKRASFREQEELDRELMRKSIDLQKEKRVAFSTFASDVSSGWGNTISSLIKGDMEFADFFGSITDNMLGAFGNACGKIVEKWFENHLTMESITTLFGIKKKAADAAIIASNSLVTASNTATAGIAAGTAATTAAAAASTSTAAGGLATAMVGPITALAGAFAALALSTTVVAVTMPIIALSTTVVALSSSLAAFGLSLLNVVMGITATTSLMFAPISLILAAEFAVIRTAALLTAKAVAQLAIALAAASAAAIPFVGWALAPAAAAATGAAIASADTMVQFREHGGPVKKGQSYIVGEKRPELFIPDRDGSILPNTNSIGGGGDTYHISVAMPISAMDVKSFEGKIDEMTERIHSNLFKKIKRRKLNPLAT